MDDLGYVHGVQVAHSLDQQNEAMPLLVLDEIGQLVLGPGSPNNVASSRFGQLTKTEKPHTEIAQRAAQPLLRS